MPRHATSSAFKKGNPGKPKGAVSHFTTLKHAFLHAFERLGGEDAIIDWVNEKIEIKNKKGKVIRVYDYSGERRKDFFRMIAQMLPRDVQLSGSTVTQVIYNINGRAMSERERLVLQNADSQQPVDSRTGQIPTTPETGTIPPVAS
jgi:hypothetical protein